MSVRIINSDEFKNVTAKGLVLVDFFATWCGPCKMIAPILEEVSNELNDVEIVKVDVDENLPLAGEFRISGVPTLVLFKDGQEIDRVVGFMVKKDLINWIKKYQ